MSFDIRSSRALSNDPFGRTLTDLSKRLSAFLSKDQAAQVENPEDIYSDAQDVESVLKYHSLALVKKFPLNVFYSSASEPDLDKVKLFLASPFPNLGNQLIDDSGFDNHATITGEPVLVDGNFDLGIADGSSNVRSVAVRFNRPESQYENGENMSIPDVTNLRVSGIISGISYFIRFRIFNLSQQNGQDRRLFEKTDDSSRNNGVQLYVTSDGKLKVDVKRAGSSHAFQTAAGVIATNTVYDVFLTYAVSGDVVHIYVNGVDKSLSSVSGPPWHSDSSDLSLNIFRRGGGSADGYIYGDFYAMENWREKVVSSTEVSHHFTNKWTLADILFGQVAISNYCVSETQTVTSFSSSFTSSFTH